MAQSLITMGMGGIAGLGVTFAMQPTMRRK
ncbi:Uncharacterised protein [Vibrio cholerae]|nr:Uncharacterised protein [Vibrio cholerae]